MSMPTIPDMNPKIDISREDAVTLIIASIAMEELALAHILNAEGEKLQYVLGTLGDKDPGEITICDVMAVNKSIQKTLRDVIKTEMLLQFKLEDAAALIENEDDKCNLSIKATVTWRDSDNVDRKRPAVVTVNLLQDGKVYRTGTINTSGDNVYTFACVPVWKDSEYKYTYQVDLSETPTGYTKSVDGFDIINTIEPGVEKISGSKIWVDNHNAGGDRPQTITVNLLQNGKQLYTTPLQSPPAIEDKADFTFPDAPRFDNEGKLYVYTVDEANVPPIYAKNIVGYIITNTHATL